MIMAEWDADIPTLDTDALELMGDADPMKTPEAQALPHLDLARFEETGIDRSYIDASKVTRAAEAIGTLPRPDQAIHLIVGGQFSLWDTVPAILALATPATIDTLHLATLSFSTSNVTGLADLLDSGKVQRVTLLVSHYFRATSPEIALPAIAALEARGQRWFTVRNHTKLILAKLTDGRTIAIESSANLRSKANLEQMTLYGDPGVYTFHASWLDRLANANAASFPASAPPAPAGTLPAP